MSQIPFLIFITLATQINCESACVEMKRSRKLQDFHNTRRNVLSVTNVSCTINYFDITAVNRLTLNVVSNSESLRILDLSHNRISEIYNETFSDFVSLVILKLRDNFLTTTRENHFGYLRELSGVDLSSNLLESIDIKTFSKLPNLLWLNIEDNCLINIFRLLLPIRALDILDLSHNHIDCLPQLSGISAITNLDLSYNNITDLMTTATTTAHNSRIEIVQNLVSNEIVKSISSLNIAGNQLRHLNQLLSFINLVELNLADNIIDYIENENIIRYFSSSMQKLNLTNTSLTSLNIFRYLNGENIHELSLLHNPLSTDFNQLVKFSNLKHLEIQQNFCYELDSFTIKRNFKLLKCVAIFYDIPPECACVKRNEMLLKFESIDFITDWSVCSSASTLQWTLMIIIASTLNNNKIIKCLHRIVN